MFFSERFGPFRAAEKGREFLRGGSWAGSCFPSKNCLEEERGVSLRGRGSSAPGLQEMKEAACLVKSRFFKITAQFFLFFFFFSPSRDFSCPLQIGRTAPNDLTRVDCACR